MAGITVIVPVYADWSSLDKCIESLKEYSSKSWRIDGWDNIAPRIPQSSLAQTICVVYLESCTHMRTMAPQTCL